MPALLRRPGDRAIVCAIGLSPHELVAAGRLRHSPRERLLAPNEAHGGHWLIGTTSLPDGIPGYIKLNASILADKRHEEVTWSGI